MTGELFAFLVFSLITMIGGIGVVLSRNLVRAALWLLFSLFGVAGLLALMSAAFLAMVQVLIYMGGITILIIFAVMLTRSMVNLKQVYNEQWGMAAILAAAFFAVMAIVIIQVAGDGAPMAAGDVPQVIGDTTVRLGTSLVSPSAYVLPFEVASLLLAGALIGAIYIARDEDDDAPELSGDPVVESLASDSDEAE